jgi:hypothetical protein
MTDKFNTTALHKRFEERDTISIDELYQFYKQEEPDLLRSTLRWRMHQLTKQGELHRIGRGKYGLGASKEIWRPEIKPDLKSIYTDIQQEFPYLQFCIWSTQWLLGFTQHVPFKHITLIDTERDTEASVFHYLQDTLEDHSVYLNPGKSEVQKYIGTNDQTVVVRPLISQSPLLKKEETSIPKLEKIMIDLVADDILFGAYQGKELQTIYENILGVYAINQSTLRRYAQRRNKWDEVNSYLEQFSNKVIDS